MITVLLSVYLFIAVIVVSYIGAYVFTKRRNSFALCFALLSIIVSLYLFGYLMEINSASMSQMVFWNKVQYIGLPFYPSFWLVITILYTKKKINVSTIAFIFFIPALTFIFRLTNSFHNLFYSYYKIIELSHGPILNLGKGPFYYVHSVYIITSIILSNVLLIEKRRRSKSKRRYSLMMAASIIPMLGVIFILLDSNRLGIDYSALLSPLAIGIIMYAILRYDLMDIRALGRDTVFLSSHDGILITDPDNKILDYNKSAEGVFGLEKIALKHDYINEIIADNRKLQNSLLEDTTAEFCSNKRFYYEVETVQIKNKNDELLGKLKTIRDVTDRKKILDRLNYLAYTDELCKLNNRRHFMELGNKLLIQGGITVSMLMIDIDHFKQINDQYGHIAGDSVLKKFSSLLQESFKENSITGRLGGEEFGVLIINEDAKGAYHSAEQFRKLVNDSDIIVDDNIIRLTVSIGIASNEDNKELTFNDLMSLADRAMYLSKTRGRNCCSQ